MLKSLLAAAVLMTALSFSVAPAEAGWHHRHWHHHHCWRCGYHHHHWHHRNW